MKEYTFKQMMDMLQESKPAKIEAKSDENGKMSIEVDDRGLEIIALSLAIAEKLINTSNGALTVDHYCGMLKSVINECSKSKEQKDVEMEIAKKIFESVFK